MSSEKGSFSLEAALVLSVFILVLALFFSLIQGYRLEARAFSQATIYLLEHNDEYLSAEDFSQHLSWDYLEVDKNFKFKAMKLVVEDFSYENNGFSQPLEEVVFITDYGKMYHLPGCPTVKKSLKPAIKKDVPHLSPCSVCHKK